MTNKIHLEKVTWDNYQKVLKLRVTKEQENFVASNKASLIHAFLSVSISGSRTVILLQKAIDCSPFIGLV